MQEAQRIIDLEAEGKTILDDLAAVQAFCDQAGYVVEALARLKKLDDSEQSRSDSAFNLKQLFGRACVALNLKEDECSWFDVVGQIEKSATTGPAGLALHQLLSRVVEAPHHFLIGSDGHKELYAAVAGGWPKQECPSTGQVTDVDPVDLGISCTFTAQLFDAMNLCQPGSSLIYNEGHELVSTDEIRYASGDGVMIEFSDGDEYLFMDQEVLIDSGGHCPVIDSEGRQFYFTLQVARPLVKADLEKPDV